MRSEPRPVVQASQRQISFQSSSRTGISGILVIGRSIIELFFIPIGKEGYLQNRDQMLRRTSYAGEACSRPPVYPSGKLSLFFLPIFGVVFSHWCTIFNFNWVGWNPD